MWGDGFVTDSDQHGVSVPPQFPRGISMRLKKLLAAAAALAMAGGVMIGGTGRVQTRAVHGGAARPASGRTTLDWKSYDDSVDNTDRRRLPARKRCRGRSAHRRYRARTTASRAVNGDLDRPHHARGAEWQGGGSRLNGATKILLRACCGRVPERRRGARLPASVVSPRVSTASSRSMRSECSVLLDSATRGRSSSYEHAASRDQRRSAAR